MYRRYFQYASGLLRSLRDGIRPLHGLFRHTSVMTKSPVWFTMSTMNVLLYRQRLVQIFPFLSPWANQPGTASGTLETIQFRLLDAGTVLMRPGAACLQLPLVLSGTIRIYKTSESGREITLYRIQAGQSCMLSARCARGPSQFPATAVTEAPTLAAFLPDTLVEQLLQENTGFRDFILDQYSQRMGDVMELVEEVAFRRVDQRLQEFLANHGGNSGEVAMTHQELAAQIGSSREVISRILKDWEALGHLELGRGKVILNQGFYKLRF